VGLVALIAVELHRCLFRHDYLYGLIDCFLIRLIVGDIERRISAQLFPDSFISMAEETLLAARLEVFCAVSMTVQAGELFHSRAMDGLSLMTFYAEALFGGELMRAVSVALNALNLLHEYVLCMHSRLIDRFCVLEFFIPFPMAFDTVFPGDNDLAMSVRDRGRAVENKTDEKFVLLRNGQVMTVMAIEILMLTGCPCIIGRLHEVATDTEFRIVLRKIIKFKSNDAATDKHGKKKNCDNDLSF